MCSAAGCIRRSEAPGPLMSTTAGCLWTSNIDCWLGLDGVIFLYYWWGLAENPYRWLQAGLFLYEVPNIQTLAVEFACRWLLIDFQGTEWYSLYVKCTLPSHNHHQCVQINGEWNTSLLLSALCMSGIHHTRHLIHAVWLMKHSISSDWLSAVNWLSRVTRSYCTDLYPYFPYLLNWFRWNLV